MSAHRITYRPAPQRHSAFTARAAFGAVAVVAVLGTAVIAISRGGEDAGPIATPIPTPDVRAFPLEPLDGQRLADIRVEAFRAGMATALQDGCVPGPLATPIALGQP
jgi:hypothetical protein